ncbi:cupin domain-containing protein [Tissierella sp.]|uniref:cupin domain-containing protein n=1 Tax=Tissierella sp. TaxID=41274 RepID=UPI00285D1892|nr:cupin domain-containing protein [Tissierella sp.]MDR7857433.1 cupin domain-containing protein [Tissierella sp.]
MNNIYEQYKAYNNNSSIYDPHIGYPQPCCNRPPIQHPGCWEQCIDLSDHGPNPYVVNIEEATRQNYTFRTALWTGEYLQLTVMSINPRDDVGLELHSDHDQFLRIEEGQGLVLMGDSRDNLYFQERVSDGYVIFVPAGKWHNLINIGCVPLKLYSIYAPPQHPHGTVHRTKEDAEGHSVY